MITDFDLWYSALPDPLKVAFMGAIVAIIVAVISAIVAGSVAWVQARIALRSLKIQERTVYLSLIERRSRWLDQAINAWDAWIAQQEKRVEAILSQEPLPADHPRRAIGNCRLEARWLFGPEIDEYLEQLELAVREYASRRSAIRELGFPNPADHGGTDNQDLYEDYSESVSKMLGIRAELSNKTRPYLFVGDIKAQNLPRPTV